MHKTDPRSGNIFVYILGAIFLLGILIVLVKGNSQEGVGIDSEQAVLKATEVQRYASELERGVNYILRENSENAIRFAHDDADPAYGTPGDTPTRQVFEEAGGGVEYKQPPADVNDSTEWQFYATTHITDLGTNDTNTQKAELIAVLPNMKEAVCKQLNLMVHQNIDLAVNTDPTSNGCVYAGASVFAGTYASGSGVNVMTSSAFTNHPAREACVKCEDGGFHYYRVLIAR